MQQTAPADPVRRDVGPGARVAVLGLHAAALLAFFVLGGELVRSAALALSPLLTALTIAGITRVRRPPRAWAWYLLAAGLSGSAVGWSIWYLTPWGDGVAGDVAFLSGYAAAALALLGLGGLRERRAQVALLDAGLLTIGLGVLAWVLVVSRVTAAPDVTTAQRLISTAYPILGVLLVAVTVRLLLGGARGWRSRLILLWALAQGVGDTVYALTVIEGSFRFGSPVFALWLLSYGALTAAVLVRPGDSAVVQTAARSRMAPLVVVAAVLPLPVLLVARAVEGSSRHVLLIAVGSVAMTVLAMTRGAVLADATATPVARAAVRRSIIRSTAGFVVLALLPIAGVSYVAVAESQRVMEREIRDRMAVTAAVSANYVEEQLGSIRTLVGSYATRPQLLEAAAAPGGPDRAALDPHMRSLQEAHPGLFGAWFLGARGEMVSFQPTTPSVMNRSYAFRDYFRGATSQDEPYVSAAFTAARPGNPRAVGVSIAVRDAQGELLGVVTAGYRLDAVRAFADRLADVQGVRLTVADQQGQLLAGERDGLLPDPDALVSAALAGRTATVRVGSGDHVELASYRGVDALEWAVVAEVSEASAMAAADRLAARIVIAAVLLAQLLLLGLVAAVRADSRRRVAEAALLVREEHLRRVLDAAGDAYVSIDGQNRITAWNEQATAVFGHAAADALGRDLADLALPDEAREAHRAGVVRVMQGGRPRLLGTRVEVEAVHADGHRFPAEITLWASGTAESPSYNAFVRDVTQVKEQEKALAEAHEAALEASRLKSEFVANMSHEIRTPMNGVLGMTALLSDTDLDPIQRDYVETVGSCAESLLTVIDDILDFSKIEAGKLDLEVTVFELRPLVEDVVGLLGSSAGSRGVEVVAWIDPAVPTHVHGDPHRLRQVLNNLVGNAVKYTEQGEVVVHLEPSAQQDDVVRVSVRDTGIGITAEQRTRLFEAFSQADASTTRKYGGTGLGLTISRQLVELMGGALDVESTPGSGSTFFFELPLRAAEAPTADVRKRRCMAGVRVLVVDDNSTNRKVLRQYLTAWAVEPMCVADAGTALAELRVAASRGTPYDVVVLDMHMPGTDGLQLAHAIVADAVLGSTPMAMLTSTNQRGERAAAKAAGIGAYLTKPIRQAQLYDRLSELLGAAPQAPAPARPSRAGEHVGRILVAEDNRVNQQVVEAMLTSLGYAVDLAEDGRRAVELATSRAYDVVLMDCQMPVLDGFGATREIRASGGAAATTPVIALTASALASDEQRCRSAGMDDFLSKPLRREALVQVLRRWASAAPDRVHVPAQAAPAAEPSCLDAELLDEMLQLGPAFLDVVAAYLGSTPARVDEIESAAARGDADAVQQHAHALAGSSSCVGAVRVAAAATAVELAARAARLPDLGELRVLRHEHGRAAAALGALTVPENGGISHARAGR